MSNEVIHIVVRKNLLIIFRNKNFSKFCTQFFCFSIGFIGIFLFLSNFFCWGQFFNIQVIDTHIC